MPTYPSTAVCCTIWFEIPQRNLELQVIFGQDRRTPCIQIKVCLRKFLTHSVGPLLGCVHRVYTQSGNGHFLANIPSWWKNKPRSRTHDRTISLRFPYVYNVYITFGSFLFNYKYIDKYYTTAIICKTGTIKNYSSHPYNPE